jgi:cell division protein FtsI (penicillin-binding protein 3)
MKETAPAHWRATLRKRMTITAIVLGVWMVGIEARLVVLQVVQHRDLVARAMRQQMSRSNSAAKRGDILDRRGQVLATSVSADSIYAVPSAIEDPKGVVAALCNAFGDCTGKERDSLVEKLGKNRAFAYVRRHVSPDEAKRVAALNLDGIGFIKEDKRFYPNKELAAHLLGYVGLDNQGLNGLEFTYDAQIRGKAGTVLVQTDARRHAFSRVETLSTTGSTVELTIDEYLQHIAERELHAGVLENRAAGGSAIIMNPRTGEILAMANEPTFNPNVYRDFDEADRRNRAVQDLYEPGSTFKVVTVSAALEEKIMTPDTLIDTNPGRIQIGKAVITENENHNYQVIPLREVIVRSSNVGAIKIGFKLGTERLSRYVGLYGFGHSVSRDFPGESPGIVWSPEKWTDLARAEVSMGYQVAVTPLQIVAAVSSVANGGQYVEPRVIHAVYRDNRRYIVQPNVERRIISADTAAAMTAIMEGVVGEEHGTAPKAQISGFTVAGKTGTAAKLVGGRYSHSEYNASFVGFVPSREPAVAIVVVIDSPHGPNRFFGGTVSAPIFKRIAEATLRYMGIGQTINPMPPVLVARHDDNATGANTVSSASTGQGADSPTVSLVSDGPPGTMPDLRGMSARDALRRMMRLGLAARVDGSGFVVSQDPPAGAPLDAVSTGRVTLARSSNAHQEQARP